jgi:hypothetical protein
VAGAGTLTLLFTDLVGSTESLVALGEERYDSVRDEHEVLVGGTIAAQHGEIVKSTGDGYMATFHRVLAILDARAGDFESADRRLAELIAIRKATGNRPQLLGAHAIAAELAASRGDVARATSHLAAGAELAREMPSSETALDFILSAAYVAYMDGRPDDAAVLYGARLARGHPPRPRLGRPILEALENQGLDEEIAAGADLSADEALERAIEIISPPTAPSAAEQ